MRWVRFAHEIVGSVDESQISGLSDSLCSDIRGQRFIIISRCLIDEISRHIFRLARARRSLPGTLDTCAKSRSRARGLTSHFRIYQKNAAGFNALPPREPPRLKS